MENNQFDNNNVTMFVFAIIALIIFLWIVFPFMTTPRFVNMERFNGVPEHTVVVAETPTAPVEMIPETEAEMQVEAEMRAKSNMNGVLPETETASVPQMPSGKPGNIMLNKKPPHVDPKTGIVMDGPGFEKGEIEGTYMEGPSAVPSNYYFLDDGAGGEFSIQHNLCSKSCCSEQWPTPFRQKYDPYVCQNKDKFVPSRIFCNNTFQDSGCLCLSKKQAQFMYNRGGNGREWF